MAGTSDHPANALASERSAYLRAHAHDPVRWRPWGAKAFRQAEKDDKPIFLSIGYQSCHWCHVMQRESFRDVDTAGILNREFVPVKVDREIRPDVDAFYMEYVQASTGSGGWPMSVFLTPDGRPLLGGTYFPAHAPRDGVPSFRRVMELVKRAWTLERDNTLEVADEAVGFLGDQRSGAGAPIDRETIVDAAAQIIAMANSENGGFGGAPKFPQASVITFLLEQHRLAADDVALQTALRAVIAMIRGGIYDQAGGGLFRYSVDAQWLAPHFEKMLYDNALLLSTLAALHEISPAEEFAHIARQTAAFMQRDLGRPEGGFYSSLDAETAGVEGDTYVWTYDELATLLTAEELALAEEHLGVTREGNWERHTTILTRRQGRRGDAEAADGVLEKVRIARAERAQPGLIDNVIVSWNALAARGLIEAGAALTDDALTTAGLATLDAMLDEAVWRDEVLHALGDRSVAKVRFLEDASAMVAACLSAVDLAGRPKLLKTALRLQNAAVERFEADEGFVMSAGDDLLATVPLEQSDSPTPAGASLLAENALRLAELTDDPSHADVADRALLQFGRTARSLPYLAGHALAGAAMRERMRD